ncbi:MAG: hypothetical protein QOD99_1244 [Chthoniobacter sp.]|nr:hypothetical protein [Chthoniobacter sp.]
MTVFALNKAVTPLAPRLASEKNALSVAAGAVPVTQLVPALHVPDVTSQVLFAALATAPVAIIASASTIANEAA